MISAFFTDLLFVFLKLHFSLSFPGLRGKLSKFKALSRLQGQDDKIPGFKVFPGRVGTLIKLLMSKPPNAQHSHIDVQTGNIC